MLSVPKHDHAKLKARFAAEPLSQLSFGLYYSYGFILSMVSAPDIIQPSEWLPMLFKSGEMPAFNSKKELEAVSGALISIWSFWADETMDTETLTLPPGCALDADGLPTPELSDFCDGYLMGCDWLRELWAEALEGHGEGAAEEQLFTAGMFLCLLIFKGHDLPDDAPEEIQQLKSIPPAQTLEMLPGALTDVAALGRALHMASLRKSEPVKADPKPGRNDPCPCGSGKKYKKCCMLHA